MGIEYFEWYLKYLKNEISKNSFREESLLNAIDRIMENVAMLKLVFEDLLKEEGVQPHHFERRFDNIYGLLNDFYEYCNNKVVFIDK